MSNRTRFDNDENPLDSSVTDSEQKIVCSACRCLILPLLAGLQLVVLVNGVEYG